MREAALKRVTTQTILLTLVGTMVMALGYYEITMMTQGISYTPVGQWGFRPALILRALALATPAGAGTALGSMWAHIATGNAVTGIYLFTSFVHLMTALCMYWIGSRTEKISHVKNIAILVVVGIIMGATVALNKAVMVSAITHFKFWDVLFVNTLIKTPSNVVGMLSGYPVYLAYIGVRDKIFR